MTEKSSKVAAILKQIPAWLLVLWAGLLTLYFQHREGLISWKWLQGPPFNFEASQRPGVFRAVLRNAFESYSINWANGPYLELLVAGAIFVGLLSLGWFILDCFEIYLTPVCRLCIATAIGSGVFGILIELFCMAGILVRPVVIATWVASLALAVIARTYLQSSWNRPIETPDGSRLSIFARQELAADWYRAIHPFPLSIPGRAFFFTALGLTGLICLLVLLHGIGQPESYWDSLILYMGYAKLTFESYGFPTKIVGQVGIGLGANYPHLAQGLFAQTATLCGSWSDSFCQLLPPLCSILSTAMVFYIALEISASRYIAITAALLYRAIPYGLSYGQFASDYAFAIYYTTVFLYFGLRYVKDGLPPYRWLMLLIAACAVHINYLMWSLWLTAAVFIFLAHWNRRSYEEPDDTYEEVDVFHMLDTDRPLELRAPSFLSQVRWIPLAELFKSREFWISTVICLALASPWYLRNTILTGNPVYAFFYNIFPSKFVNPEVMKSAEQEWRLNGDGLCYAGSTLFDKIKNSWFYFVTGPHHWKLAPVFMAFCIPGFLLYLARMVDHISQRSIREAKEREMFERGERLPSNEIGSILRYLTGVSFLFLLLGFYAYVLADFYLYQVIIILPIFAIFTTMTLRWCEALVPRAILYALALLIGFSPGVIMGLMGFKLKNTGVYVGMPPPQVNVTALRRLFMDRNMFYRSEYGGDWEMIGKVNQLPYGCVLLTHENRHLLLDPSLVIVHLDDWEVQKTYRKPLEQRLAILDNLRITHYLYVPNEDKHVVNSLVGMDELIAAGYFEKEYETKSSGSSNRNLSPHTEIPPDKNVLYRRNKNAVPGQAKKQASKPSQAPSESSQQGFSLKSFQNLFKK